MNQNKIIVSCLCIAEGNINSLEKSIDCFIAQTYKKSELIIFYRNSININQEANLFRVKNIRFFYVESPHAITLDDIVSNYLHLCKGEFLCIWNPMDWHHTKRLECQLQALTMFYKPACLLANVLLYNELQQETFYSHAKMWEGTLFCNRKIFSEKIDEKILIDNTSGFLQRVLNIDMIYPLIQPTLYIYRFNSKIQSEVDHFNKVAKISQRLSPDLTELIAQIIKGKLSNVQGSRKLNSKRNLNEIQYWHWPGNIPQITELQLSKPQSM